MDWIQKFDVVSMVENSSQKFKEIIKNKSLTHDGEENLERNTKVLLVTITENVYGQFGAVFGFSETTVKFLPGKG